MFYLKKEFFTQIHLNHLFCTKETPPPSIPLGEKSETVYIFTEIYRRIAVYKSTVYFSRCLFVEMEEGFLKKTYCSDLLSLIHITYGTHIKTKYMYMRFQNYVADAVCPLLFETYLFN